jgi:hypothetical protein
VKVDEVVSHCFLTATAHNTALEQQPKQDFFVGKKWPFIVIIKNITFVEGRYNLKFYITIAQQCIFNLLIPFQARPAITLDVELSDSIDTVKQKPKTKQT